MRRVGSRRAAPQHPRPRTLNRRACLPLDTLSKGRAASDEPRCPFMCGPADKAHFRWTITRATSKGRTVNQPGELREQIEDMALQLVVGELDDDCDAAAWLPVLEKIAAEAARTHA